MFACLWTLASEHCLCFSQLGRILVLFKEYSFSRLCSEEGQTSLNFPCCKFPSAQQCSCGGISILLSVPSHHCLSSQAEDMVKKKPRPGAEANSRRCQQTLTELESVLSHLEGLFARTQVPRVLILLGGSALSPKEFYELDLSCLAPSSMDQSLSTAACLRRLFRAIFLANAFSELQAPPLMGTTVMVLGHRDCGEDWFRPKLNYRVPSRGHKLTVTLSCGRPSIPASTWEDYIWFQAPVTLKGFHE
ncbi:MAD2L1-binding protein isoform X2 [Sorex araneus]|uniref:MAD2L1-binding protein isoform X2 n=1 Tax=Sorex araneus TaxID=42254 RepID=UPI0024337A99|nr:MAD2L1-binding protein isoform X2 [Sorex araneus]